MRINPGLFAASLLAIVPAVAGAAVPAGADLPGPVAAWLSQARQDCPSGFQARGDAIRPFSLTGDGRPGYIADPHKLSCASEPHLFVGDGPASIELFVTLPSGEVVHTGGVRALGYQVMPAPQGGAPIIAFQTHGEGDAVGSIDDYRWDGQNFAMLNRQSMARPPVDGPDSEYQR